MHRYKSRMTWCRSTHWKHGLPCDRVGYISCLPSRCDLRKAQTESHAKRYKSIICIFIFSLAQSEVDAHAIAAIGAVGDQHQFSVGIDRTAFDTRHGMTERNVQLFRDVEIGAGY